MSQIDREKEGSREFDGPAELTGMDRREFMKYLGLFSSMGFLSQCSRKAEHIVPYVKELEEFSVRNYEYYTSVFNCEGLGQGILVKSFQGRPIKVEGNPEHPASLGSTGPQAQSVLYELYHPDRFQTPSWGKEAVTWEKSLEKLQSLTEQWGKGEGVVLVLPPDHSPTMRKILTEFKSRFPQSRLFSLSPWARSSLTTYDLSRASTVVSFDEELFDLRPDHLRLSRDFMKRRLEAVNSNKPEEMNLLLSFHSSPTLTSAKADRARPMSQTECWNLACELFLALEGKDNVGTDAKELARLLRERKSSVVALSPQLDARAMELEAAINERLPGQLATYRNYELPYETSVSGLKELVKKGGVHTLVALDSDLLYWDQEWKELFPQVKQRIGLACFETETLLACNIRLPLGHFLEHWGDLEDFEKNISLQQPLIRPLFPSFSPLTFLSSFLNGHTDGLALVKKTHEKQNWEEILRSGVIKTQTQKSSLPTGTVFQTKEVIPGWKLKVLPDPSIRYGQYANNPVLQELPRHFSRLTWTNAFYLSEQDAKELKVKTGDLVRVITDKSKVEGPVWVSSLVLPRHIISTLGYGQKSGSPLARKRGFNAFPLLTAQSVKIEKLRGHRQLAFIGPITEMEKIPPVKLATLPLPAKINKEEITSLYPEHPLPAQEEGPQWAMTIDLTTCIGCQACVVACQVENNVPFVGEDQTRKDRAMHWLRVDTYLQNDKVYFQPVPCMHCEKAPCEVVCPVNATVHGNGGLNEMVYNRCVGTRYCSNNCPYRVRRFNFKAYAAVPSPWNLGFNPEVSVRDRGVMEKCTFCIQRIKEGERNNEPVRTACQQVCPTQAIEFGDLRETESYMVKQKRGSRNYDLLAEEGTKPRTSYLKVIRMESDGSKT